MGKAGENLTSQPAWGIFVGEEGDGFRDKEIETLYFLFPLLVRKLGKPELQGAYG